MNTKGIEPIIQLKIYVAECGGIWLMMRLRNGLDTNWAKPLVSRRSFRFDPKSQGKFLKDYKHQNDENKSY